MTEVKTGTLISGTHRKQDLIPKFLNAVCEYCEVEYAQLMTAPFGFVPAYALEDDQADWWSSEDADHALEELSGLLEDVAPVGHYFGAHPGDGADFGFWELEADI